MNNPAPFSVHVPGAAAAVFAFTFAGIAHAQFVTFSDASGALDGFVHESEALDGQAGLAWLDYDADGLLDLFLANGRGHVNGLLQNNGDGTFTNVSELAGFGSAPGAAGVVTADLDNDGDVDIVITTDGVWFELNGTRVYIYQNNGDGTFTDISESAGVAIPLLPGGAQHLAAADIDNDAFLDIFVGAPGNLTVDLQPSNLLLRNNGDLTFTNVAQGSGLDEAVGTCAASFVDNNRDGLQDLVLANCNEVTYDHTPINLFLNNGDLTFTDATNYYDLDTHRQTGGTSPGERGYWMCVGVGDYDRDLDLDLFATNMGVNNAPNQEHGLFQRQPNGKFVSVETEAGIGDEADEFGWGCSFADFDNDGYEDLVFAGAFLPFDIIGPGLASPGYLYGNNGDTTFTRHALPFDLSDLNTSGLAVADYDADGGIDIAIAVGGRDSTATGQPLLFRNQGNTRSWLQVNLVGDGVQSNRDAIGARVWLRSANGFHYREVRAGGSFLSQDSKILHFGLDQGVNARLLYIAWPSGAREFYTQIPANQRITVEEGVGIVPAD